MHRQHRCMAALSVPSCNFAKQPHVSDRLGSAPAVPRTQKPASCVPPAPAHLTLPVYSTPAAVPPTPPPAAQAPSLILILSCLCPTPAPAPSSSSCPQVTRLLHPPPPCIRPTPRSAMPPLLGPAARVLAVHVGIPMLHAACLLLGPIFISSLSTPAEAPPAAVSGPWRPPRPSVLACRHTPGWYAGSPTRAPPRR